MPKPSAATSQGLKTILFKTFKGIPGNQWFLHPDLYFFAQYWLGPFNADTGYRGTFYVRDLLGCVLPTPFAYPNEIPLSDKLAASAGATVKNAKHIKPSADTKLAGHSPMITI